MKEMGDIMINLELGSKDNRVTKEFQDYGLRLAEQLDDTKHKALYIKLAKTESRGLLQDALESVLNSNARSKGRLFMWKLKKLKEDKAKRQSEEAQEKGNPSNFQ